MKKVDFKAEVVPGVSLAGIPIGTVYDEIDINAFDVIKMLNTEISEKFGWIHSAVIEHPNLLVLKNVDGKEIPYLLYINGYGVVLHFDNFEKVIRVTVRDAYEGVYKDFIKVGSYLNDVLNIMPLEYNGFDEIYLSKDAFDENNKISDKEYRIGFIAPEVDEEEIFSQVIEGFTVF